MQLFLDTSTSSERDLEAWYGVKLNRHVFRGEATLSNVFMLPFCKGFTLRRKNLLPFGSKFFLFREGPFQKRFHAWESKQEVTKPVFLGQND